jgi:hypothetical protein
MGFSARAEQGREWMMAQDELIVAGIDVAKDKVDMCIRSLLSGRTFPSTAEGRRQLTSWLRRHRVAKAATPPIMRSGRHVRARKIWIDDALCRTA